MKCLLCGFLAVSAMAQNAVIRGGTDCSGIGHVQKLNVDGSGTCSADVGSATPQAFPAYPLFGYPSATIDNGYSFMANLAYFFRINVSVPVSFKNLAWNLSTPATSNCNGGAAPCGAQWAIYSTAGALQAATVTAYSGGAVDLNVAGDKSSAWSCPQNGCAATSEGTVTLQPGSYWLAFSSENSGVGVRAIGANSMEAAKWGNLVNGSSSFATGYQSNATSGTGSTYRLPATVTIASSVQPLPLVGITQ